MTDLTTPSSSFHHVGKAIKGLWATPTVPWLLGGILFLRISWFMVWPYLSIVLFQVYGLTPSVIGLVLGGSIAAGAISSAYAGHLSDRYGRRKVITACSLLTSASFAWLGFSGSIWAFSCSVFFVVIGNNAIDTICTSLLGDSIQDKGLLSIAFQLRYFMANVGCALGMLVGVWIGGGAGRGAFFLLPAAMYLVYGCVMWFKLTMPEIMRHERRNAASFISTLHQAFQHKTFILLLLVNTVASYLFANFNSTLIIYLTSSRIAALRETIATLVVVNAVVIAVSALPIAYFSKNISSTQRILYGFVFFFVSNLIFAIVQPSNIMGLVVATTILSLGELIVFPAIQLESSHHIPQKVRGLFFGVANLSVIGFAAAPLVGGFLLELVGGATALYAMLALIAFMMWLLVRVTLLNK